MRRAVGFLLLVVCFFGAATSPAENAQEILEKVRKKYDSIRDAELKFFQRVKSELLKTNQSVSGTLYIKKEHKYRVELQGTTIVTDGVTVWSHSVANKQVLINKFKLDASALTPERILGAAPTEYTASLAGTEKLGKIETQVLKLVPKEEASMVETMKFWVDAATWLIRKAEIVDVNGKQTTYFVNDIKVNTGIPDSRFTYKIPNGVEAVDLR